MEPQQNSNPFTTMLIIGIAIVLILAGIVWALRLQSAAPAEELLATTTPTTATTTQSKGGVSGTGGFTVTKDQTIELPTPPDFRSPIKYSADITPEVKAIIETKHKSLQDKLAKDTFDLASWIDLGALHKMGGDYAGAETAWVFVTKVAPKHPTAYANLADLYMNFLKNYPKADVMYKQELASRPDAIDAYISLAVMYENFYKAGGSPETILKKGIAANPKSVELELALARYYTRAGRGADAKAAYQAAIAAKRPKAK
jgi:tetratricopeptide (TPR) repeat protein